MKEFAITEHPRRKWRAVDALELKAKMVAAAEGLTVAEARSKVEAAAGEPVTPLTLAEALGLAAELREAV